MTIVCGLTISFEIMSIDCSTDEREVIVIVLCFGDDMQSLGSSQRYIIGLLHFTGHKAISG